MFFRNYIVGAGTLLDLMPKRNKSDVTVSLKYTNENEEIRKDWQAIGGDFWKALTKSILHEKRALLGKKNRKKWLIDNHMHMKCKSEDEAFYSRKSILSVSYGKEEIIIKISNEYPAKPISVSKSEKLHAR